MDFEGSVEALEALDYSVWTSAKTGAHLIAQGQRVRCRLTTAGVVTLATHLAAGAGWKAAHDAARKIT